MYNTLVEELPERVELNAFIRFFHNATEQTEAHLAEELASNIFIILVPSSCTTRDQIWS